MQKKEFINEINRTVPNINLTDEEVDYVYKDTSNIPELGGNTVAAIGRFTAEITITYKGKTKTYRAEDGTTFPCEFIDDYKNDFYA